MARPFCCRRVDAEPESNYFKPRGVPMSVLDEVIMTVDEFESLRLADFEGLYQEQAAERMEISRPTFGRIIESARRKVADALVNGKALKIEGGEVKMLGQRLFQCNDCHHTWSVPAGTGRPTGCPQCGSATICRAAQDRGPARRGGRRMGQGRCRRTRARQRMSGIEGGQAS